MIPVAAYSVTGNGQVGAAGPAKLEARDVTIHYWVERSSRPFLAVDRATLEVRPGEFVAIVGPSGCGKTTFINAVDGLLPISGGSLTLNGQPITKPGPDRAMVFQQASLLPWRTVLGNVRYGLELQGRLPKAEVTERSRRFIDLVGLSGFEDSFPMELSGGMQQRVNLARALATDPDMLLLDEPFAALDAQTREVLQEELLRIMQQERKTMVFVTHSIDEAILLGDRVAVLSARPGRLRELVEVPFPRPRQVDDVRTDPRFAELREHIWSGLRPEAVAAV
jgi:NitT/TauT family transport system ATP-binding protein